MLSLTFNRPLHVLSVLINSVLKFMFLSHVLSHVQLFSSVNLLQASARTVSSLETAARCHGKKTTPKHTPRFVMIVKYLYRLLVVRTLLFG